MNRQGTGGPVYGPFISRKQALEQGLKWYFTGKPCKHGHIASRQVSNRICKDCAYSRTEGWRAANKGHIQAYNAANSERKRDWVLANPERVKAAKDKYAKANKHKNAPRLARWRAANRASYRATANAYKARRNREDPYFRLSNRLRERLRKILRRSGEAKSSSTLEMTGCNWHELRRHFENQFADGMSWENMGEWHIDHIRPCASFDLTDPEQQRQCFHYSNLQPLWASHNQRKSDKWDGEAA